MENMTPFPYSSRGLEMGFGRGVLGSMKLNEGICVSLQNAPNYSWVKEYENEKHKQPGYFPNEAHSDPVFVGVLYIASLSSSGETDEHMMNMTLEKKNKKHI